MENRTLFIFLMVLFSFITPCFMSNGRKYDVETEAFKLYGEDFRTVLRRFRKTPDYLKILTDKLHDLETYLAEMSLQVLHYYHGKMAQRVNDIIGVSRFEDGGTSPTPMLYYHAYGSRRQQDDPNQEEYSRVGIKVLDGYRMFSHPLSVQERNSFKDLGFEFAGNIIHAIISNMGPVDSPPRSTRQPFGGDLDKAVPTIADQPHTHEVTTDGSSNIARGFVDETTTESFRFRVKETTVKAAANVTTKANSKSSS
ncbi:uncharacterized protein LOC118281127 isoform X2 [Spodoptera frugiperda]|uniref:Uncharacterized protein LOC118281127 isoform X2 n=1 Tax=Spodoptera frugiperda TaxID=7108 RepID=A0A9R0DZL3_SPOFR|nr:uncharacterized protein LOC118281127 isoform X2 [Spodoptera frugiperda]